jgi:hypothetical protein
MKDLMNRIHLVPVLAPSAGPSDNTAQVGAITNRQGFESLTYAIATGTLVDADATFVVLVEHGDAASLSDAAAVPDEQLVGTEILAAFTFTNDVACRKIGYVGNKQYVRITITPAANTGAAPMCVIAILGHPNQAPTVNPPA